METLKALESVGALLTHSHIIYTSGKHGASYVNKDAIYPHTALTSQLCYLLGQRFMNARIDAVIAPAIGGVILSQWVAFHLSQLTGKEVLSLYAEKDTSANSEKDHAFVIKRGYDKLSAQKRILVVEDILTTGGSVKKVVEAVRNIPAEVVGVAALCNRGQVTTVDLGHVPELFSLVEISLEAWDAAQCPLCAKQIPINTDVGHGKHLLRSA